MGAPFGALAQNLVNSYDPTHSPPEYLQSLRDLKAFLARHGLRAQRTSTRDLSEVRRLRDQVREVFDAASPGRAVQLTNALLQRAHVKLQLQDDGSALALDWTAGGARVVDQLRSAAALNLAFLLEHYGVQRLRTCAASPCEDVFVDVSKQGARRYCDIDCANRARVAQFRARARPGSDR